MSSSTFTRVTDSLRSAALTVADKIHHSASISRVKLLISKEEKLLQKTLADLGSVCFENHKNPAAEPDFSQFYESIERTQSRLVALQVKLHDLYAKKDTEAETVQEEAAASSQGLLNFAGTAEELADEAAEIAEDVAEAAEETTKEIADDVSKAARAAAKEPEEAAGEVAATVKEAVQETAQAVEQSFPKKKAAKAKPAPAENDSVPPAEQLREDTIVQLVDVVDVENEDADGALPEDLDREIISRNPNEDEPI